MISVRELKRSQLTQTTVQSRESLSPIVEKSSQLHLLNLLRVLPRSQRLTPTLESKSYRMKRKRNSLRRWLSCPNSLHLNRQHRLKDHAQGLHRLVAGRILVTAVRRDAGDRRGLIRRARKLRNTRKSITKSSDRENKVSE
jgi:hypothetical protein